MFFLTGMQGLALAYDLEKVQFPEGMIISFDHKKSLMKTFDDCHAVPIIQHWKSDEGFSSWSFQAVYFEMKCQADYLICFLKNNYFLKVKISECLLEIFFIPFTYVILLVYEHSFHKIISWIHASYRTWNSWASFC